MKAVLISIQPKWCELIANGKKTIEVRKTRPKRETPFKCYIYCTKGKVFLYKNPNNGELFLDNNGGYRGGDYEGRYLTGKVIGEFVCDTIYDIVAYDEFYGTHYGWNFDFDIADTCLSEKEFKEYLSKKNGTYIKPLNGYGWHISELKIYDKPKALWEFKPWCEESRKTDDNLEICCNCKNAFFDEDGIFFGCGVTRPPQSWFFVEEEK